MPPELHARATYVALALATIVAGLVVHLGGVPASHVARDIAGDALWGTMLTWWVSAIVPGIALGVRAALSLGACWAVEVSQLYHTPGLDAIRDTLLGHLVLGSGFDPRDFAAYGAGVVGATILEWWWLNRRASTRRDAKRSAA
jgi:hypothetical protein